MKVSAIVFASFLVLSVASAGEVNDAQIASIVYGTMYSSIGCRPRHAAAPAVTTAIDDNP